MQVVLAGAGRTVQAVLGFLQEGLRLVQELSLWAVFSGMYKVCVSKV